MLNSINVNIKLSEFERGLSSGNFIIYFKVNEHNKIILFKSYM